MKQILSIIKTGALGDVLRTTGFLKNLKKKYTYHEIWWVANDVSKEILLNNEHVSNVLSINNNQSFHQIKDITFDIILSFEDDIKCLNLATHLKKNKLIGGYLNIDGRETYTENSKLLFDMSLLNKNDDGTLTRANYLKSNNMLSFQEIMSSILEIKDPNVNNFKYVFNVKQDVCLKIKKSLELLVPNDEFIIGVNFFCGNRWKSKMFSFERACELTDFLHDNFGHKIYLSGGELEFEKNKFIHNKFKDFTYFSEKIHSTAEYSCVIKRMNLIITVDSFVLHLALLNEIKTIAVFSSTCDSEIEMFNFGIKIHSNSNFECGCFFKSECQNKCIDKIQNEKYKSAINKMLFYV